MRKDDLKVDGMMFLFEVLSSLFCLLPRMKQRMLSSDIKMLWNSNFRGGMRVYRRQLDPDQMLVCRAIIEDSTVRM